MVKKVGAGMFMLLFLALGAQAQIGGQRAFTFLELPSNARLAALGGVNVSSWSHDINMVSANPGLLQQEMDNQLSLSYTGYLADIKHSNLAYGFNNEKIGRWAVGLNYLNYGDFVQRDATGLEEGQFTVNDYTFNVSHSRTVDAFTLGATAKVAVSSMAGDKAVGMLLDVGGAFRHPEQDLTVGLAFKNIGYQVRPFTGAERQPMPFDAQLGISYKPEHMPVRLSTAVHRLYQFDIVYLDPNERGMLDENGNEIVPEKKLADKIARHFVFGAEFLLSKNFQLRAGYNHLRRKELKIDTVGGAAGFSMGLMLRVRSFELNYGAAFFHPSGGSHYVTISTNTSTFLKRKSS